MYVKRTLNLVDAELRRRNAAIIRWNVVLWPLGLIAMAVWLLSVWPR
jgi:hypothetical protein